MITVIIPSLNPEKSFAACLAALVPAVIKGIIKDVVVVDGGSREPLGKELCDATGATFIECQPGRGLQLKTGAEQARGSWLLFLHSDTVLSDGWEEEAATFMMREELAERDPAAAVFRFQLDDYGFKPRLLEKLVRLRCAMFHLPYGDQGLLISKALYTKIGGFQAMPLMEDVNLVRRLKRSQLVFFKSHAQTSAIRYKKHGYFRRMMRNAFCLTLYFLGGSPEKIKTFYD